VAGGGFTEANLRGRWEDVGRIKVCQLTQQSYELQRCTRGQITPGTSWKTTSANKH